MEDKDLSCWNETLKFHERILLTHMRNFIAVQVNIDQWHRRNKTQDNTTMYAAGNASISAMSARVRDQEFITNDTVRIVVQALMDRVSWCSMMYMNRVDLMIML